ncbi:chromosomal replication initiator DnaA [Sandaracinobacter neustonicus]|uniref:Chromosomal replication initiator DnaA n=1 Tax=Sandaracinobacter neustonicus TaxID=1715348 RepID=A0A501XE60_9SPHN|nr:DnaA/Hda family protein [Sandaracinobacter neustonicus]TPE58584.1 chromosomal replication initiator DnaA [Sandaracinobacter neustonicus]
MSAPEQKAEHQMVLPLRWRAAQGQKDFFVSDANAEAVTFLDGWSTWPVPAALLIGPAGSGKSHLAAIFARRSNARLWDDADRISNEEALFHAWNAAMDERRPLLMTARSMPADWNLTLADLKSRLAATPRVQIRSPDDALLEAVFLKQWRDRGVEAPADVTRYVLSRIERSFEGIARTVEALDKAAMSQQRPLSIPLAREVFIDLDLEER